jgi:hypothetical protein
MEIDARELLGHEVEQARLCEPLDLGVKLEPFEDVAHRRGEARDILIEVFPDVILIEVLKKSWPAVLEQERLDVQPRLFAHGLLGEHGSPSSPRARSRAVEGRCNGKMTLPYSDCL